MSRSNIIAVTNQKGGVGKTTTVVNLASSYAAMGKRVLVVDADYQANATIGLGMAHLIETNQNLKHALENNLTVDAVIANTPIPNISLVAAHPELDDVEEKISISPRRDVWLEMFLNSEILNEIDIIIIDMHPSLKGFFFGCMKAAHYYLIPLFAEQYSAAGLRRQIQAAEEIRSFLNPMLVSLGAVITKYKNNREGHHAFTKMIENISKNSNMRLLTTKIPFSDTVGDAEAECLPLNLYKNSKGQPIAHAYSALAAEIAPHLKGKRIGRKMKPISFDKIESSSENETPKVSKKKVRRIKRTLEA